jgi:hypothetical protein
MGNPQPSYYKSIVEGSETIPEGSRDICNKYPEMERIFTRIFVYL